ncbi:hypothetical protein HK100_001013 [Physocladia obscura]|uniref:Uncharacterized protein n=1 Tax=Physocladia obscura TaxID=109957 RepID=A0AAD5SXM0_9FUNG|nr:hypothetical protein HK100_001013 [Physocladia obscura]
MAQGLIKKKEATPTKTVSQTKKAAGKTKRGGTSIAPKKSALVKNLSLRKKLTAGAIVDTERQMAAKAGSTGKLTIMKATAEKGLKEIAAEKKRKGLIKEAEAKKMAAAMANKSSGKSKGTKANK